MPATNVEPSIEIEAGAILRLTLLIYVSTEKSYLLDNSANKHPNLT